MTEEATEIKAQSSQSDVGPKSGAERVREYRERKKIGTRTLRITIRNAERTLDEFIRVGMLSADRRNDDAAIEEAIAQLCKRGHRALVAEREAAAVPRSAEAPPQMSEINRRLLASLER
jgi:hypothetical protein